MNQRLHLLPALILLATACSDRARRSADDAASAVPSVVIIVTDTLRADHLSVDKEDASLAAVLFGDDKLIVDRTSGERQLYNLRSNPSEEPHGAIRRGSTRLLEERLATMLASYEASVQPGLHLELAGPYDEPLSGAPTNVSSQDRTRAYARPW